MNTFGLSHREAQAQRSLAVFIPNTKELIEEKIDTDKSQGLFDKSVDDSLLYLLLNSWLLLLFSTPYKYNCSPFITTLIYLNLLTPTNAHLLHQQTMLYALSCSKPTLNDLTPNLSLDDTLNQATLIDKTTAKPAKPMSPLPEHQRPTLTLQIPPTTPLHKPTVESYLLKRWGATETSPATELERELEEAELNQGCVDNLQDTRLPWAEKTRVRVGRYPGMVRLDGDDSAKNKVVRPDRSGIGGWLRIERPAEDVDTEKEKEADGWEVLAENDGCEDWILL